MRRDFGDDVSEVVSEVGPTLASGVMRRQVVLLAGESPRQRCAKSWSHTRCMGRIVGSIAGGDGAGAKSERSERTCTI